MIVTFPQGYGGIPVTLTRPADTAAYLGVDVIGAATGSTAALTFLNMGPLGGGEIMLTSSGLAIYRNALIASEAGYTLEFYNITPPSALGDNAPWNLVAGDRSSHIGSLSLGTPVHKGDTLKVELDSINKQIRLASSNLYAYLVTAAGYTPASADVYVITLHSVAI